MKFFDPLNSIDDPEVHISVDDEKDPHEEEANDTNSPNTMATPQTSKKENLASPTPTRVTRSKTNSLPSNIVKYSSSAIISSHNVPSQWKYVPWVSDEMNIILHSEGSTVGQHFPI